jgi:hypothetical protein
MLERMAILSTGQHAGEIEPESIHVHFFYPKLKRLQNECGDNRMVAVDCVATSRIVSVDALVGRVKVI